MPITQSSVINDIKRICEQVDQKHAPLQVVQYGQTRTYPNSYDLLAEDGNLEGLAGYLMREINGAGFRDGNNAYLNIAKHQLVGILNSFVERSGTGEGKAAILPVIEGIADYLLASIRGQRGV